MYLIHIDDSIAFGFHSLENHLQAVLEVTTILGAGKQGAEVKLIDHAVLQTLRNIAIDNTANKTIDESRLANAWLANMKRIVFILAAEYLNGALQFSFTTY